MHRILIIEMDIRLFTAASLKDKRSIRKRLIDKLKLAYNVSVVETSYQDKWQRLGVTLAYVAIDETRARKMAQTLRDACDNYLEGDGELSSFQIEII